MVNFTVDEMRSVMDLKHNIRSISVIAHFAHGKTILTDSLVETAGITFSKATGGALWTDTCKDRAKRRITIKSTCVSTCFEYDREAGEVARLSVGEGEVNKKDLTDKQDEKMETKKTFLINLIDSPGHIDFSSEVTAALRITDGALVVVDSIDGVCVQTENVLRQAVSERVKPVLMVNRVDRALLELQLPAEELYQAFCRAIECVNVILAMYNDEALGDVQVDPTIGSVCFGSGLHRWAFTLKHFAKIYGAKFNVPENKMMSKLWGNWYFDASRKLWTSSNKDGNLERAFCQFIASPITALFGAITAKNHGKVNKMLKAIGVELKSDEQELAGEALLKRVMQKWLPVRDTVLNMIVIHLPSPAKAQKYRVATLYNGPLDDVTATSIGNCDASDSAPLCMYISKMIPTSDKGQFYGFGRVFSGKIATGQKVRILGPEYVPGKNTELWVKHVQLTVIIMGRYTEQVADVPAGNICALVGIDQYLLKSGTIVTAEDAHTIKTMKFSVSPVVRCTIEPKKSADLPQLIEGMKRLEKSDPMVLCCTEESGEHIVAASGELHLEVCLRDLQQTVIGTEVKVSDPFVSFRETCYAKSSTCLAKSPNKHNRLFVEADCLGPELCTAIDEGDVFAGAHAKLQGQKLVNEFGWGVSEAQNIWAFGPGGTGPNLFVDTTKGVNYLQQMKESIVCGFSWAAQNGPLCEEQMRGCRFNLMDVVSYCGEIYRGINQLMPTARRVCFSSMMTAEPGLLEPIYLCNISVPQDEMGNVYGVLTKRRGHVFSEEQRPGTPQTNLLAYLPVVESFGFTVDLQSNTGRKALQQCSFDHWEPISGMMYNRGKVAETILTVRARKGLKDGIPEIGQYLDKL